jgi:hypothetical protein
MAIKARTQYDDDITLCRKLALVLPKDFAEGSFPPVTFHSISDTPTGNHAEATCRGGLCFALQALKNKRPAVDTLTLTADLLKFALLTQTL